jgi:7-alpha-hydroxysteroid dehydrogenase
LSYMTKLMSRDLAPRIRVNAVASGSTWTPALERYYTAAELGANIARTPMRRLGTPEDVALAVLFLRLAGFRLCDRRGARSGRGY